MNNHTTTPDPIILSNPLAFSSFIRLTETLKYFHPFAHGWTITITINQAEGLNTNPALSVK